MSTKTTNLNLIKPDSTDNADISVINNNMDLIDAAVASKEPSITTKNSAFNQSFETNASNIKMDGTTSVGTSSNVARADHVHPSDTTKANSADLTAANTNVTNVTNSLNSHLADTTRNIFTGRLTASALNSTTLAAGLYENTGDGIYQADGVTFFKGVGTWWYVEVMHHLDGNGYATQFLSPLNSTAEYSYFRMSNGTTWGPWIPILDARHLATPVAGAPVVPVSAASCVETIPQTTSATNILTFTPSASGCFDLKSYIRVGGACNVQLTLTYTDAAGVQVINIVPSQVIAAGSYVLPTAFFYAVGGQGITVTATTSNPNFVAFTNKLVGV